MQTETLQDQFLNQLRKSHMPATVFLMNGFQIRGTVADHDDAIVVLETEGKQQIVYKHAISTIIPFRPLKGLKEK